MGARVYPNVPRAYVDLDGTTFDLAAAASAAGLSIQEMKHRQGAYRHLPLIDGAAEAIAALAGMGYLVFFATKIPQGNKYAAAEKMLQVDEVFPEVGERVIITPDKGCIGTARDILIDDKPEWANAHAFPGRIFKFAGDWSTALAWARKVKSELDHQEVPPPAPAMGRKESVRHAGPCC